MCVGARGECVAEEPPLALYVSIRNIYGMYGMNGMSGAKAGWNGGGGGAQNMKGDGMHAHGIVCICPSP